MPAYLRNGFILFSFLLLSVSIIGIFWLVTTPGAGIGLIFAYAAGLSMIFLPCTLPLVFVFPPYTPRQAVGYKEELKNEQLLLAVLIVSETPPIKPKSRRAHASCFTPSLAIF